MRGMVICLGWLLPTSSSELLLTQLSAYRFRLSAKNFLAASCEPRADSCVSICSCTRQGLPHHWISPRREGSYSFTFHPCRSLKKDLGGFVSVALSLSLAVCRSANILAPQSRIFVSRTKFLDSCSRWMLSTAFFFNASRVCPELVEGCSDFPLRIP